MISRKLVPFLKSGGFDFQRPIAVFDVGARDCKESVEALELFPNAKVYSFECNPQTLPLCRAEEAAHGRRLTLVAKAVNSYTGVCKFHPINPQKTRTTWTDGNPGASSLFVSNGTYRVEHYVQDTIEVPCTRLDDACKELGIESVAIVWMDLQGAELLALQSMGDFLKGVEYMCVEVSYKPIYSGQVLFPELNAFLEAAGFECINTLEPNSGKWQEDAIYRRKGL
jgi:FkbM family methyltransferase